MFRCSIGRKRLPGALCQSLKRICQMRIGDVVRSFGHAQAVGFE
jgi:hypothetical protein